jgi:hypothetical protein
MPNLAQNWFSILNAIFIEFKKMKSTPVSRGKTEACPIL